MATIQKRYGITLNLYLDGTGGASDLSLYCQHNSGTAYLCPYALGEIMPMEDGTMCALKRDGACPRHAAQLDVLKRAKSVISARIKEVEEELKNAD